MSRSVRFEAEASIELREAAHWYEGRRDGLGMVFLAAVDLAVERIAEWPETGAPVPGVAPDLLVRRIPVARFPYHVVYTVTPNAIRVLAIAHERRRPSYWSARAASRGG